MKSSKWVFILIFSVLIFNTGFVSLSWAEFKFSPSIGVREEYNDNILLTSTNREDYFITNINPAVSLGYNTRLLTLSLDYGLNFKFYSRHSEKNETSLGQAQRAKLDTTVSPYRDIFFIKVSDEYARVPIDQRRQVALDNISVNMTDSNKFFINPYIEYPLSGSLKARIGYSYQNLWYKSNEGDNTENHTATLSLIKELSSKITATLSYAYLMHRPEKTEEYDKQDATVGINYLITPKLSLNGNIGESWFDYKNRGNNSSTIGNIQANYLVTDLVSIGAGYSESFFDSVNMGTYKSKATTGTIRYNAKIPVSLTVFRKKETYTTITREDKSTGATFQAGLPVTAKLTGNLIGTYTDFKFSPDGEKVKRYGTGLSLDYKLKITTLSLGYTYNWNNSNLNDRDYKNNIVWLQARVVF